MTMKTLVMYEISQKQKYIFRTNRLIENIGASAIIRDLTENPQEFLSQVEYNIHLPIEEKKIVGGGNATYIFNSSNEAMQFAKGLSKGTLEHFPGVELFLVQREVDWQREFIYDRLVNGEWVEGILSLLRNELEKKKNQRVHAVQQYSWGVHQVCTASGLPANEKTWGLDERKKVLRTKELVVKEREGRGTREVHFSKRFLSAGERSPHNGQEFVFIKPNDFEQLFAEERDSTDRKSYVAVVHIDGNAMGTKVSSFKTQHFSTNDEYITKYQKFTEDIDKAYTEAFRLTIKHIMKDYDIWAERIYGDVEESKVNHLFQERAHIIPLRPIVASGDDICFIVYGQLGIESARLFIQYLQQQTIDINHQKHQLEACAGVAIVKHKFPFWLAYELSEKLCSNAKKRLNADATKWAKMGYGSKEKPFDTSLIDWHLVSAGDLETDIDQIRHEDYLNKDGSGSYLSQRPFYLQRSEDDDKHEASYSLHFLASMDMIENSASSKMAHARSKWKALRDVYHQGRQVVDQWQIQNQFDTKPNQLFVTLPYFGGYGWQKTEQETNKDVAYFYDALEIMDYFIRLSEVRNNEPNCDH